MKQELILVRGVPGSGKSTLARNLYLGNPSFVLLETDQYFYENGEYKFDKRLLGSYHEECRNDTTFYLEKFRSVVVSNTFTTQKELEPYFSIAKSFKIVPNIILCQGNYKSIHNVPEEIIQRMKDRFEYDISDLYKKYFG